MIHLEMNLPQNSLASGVFSSIFVVSSSLQIMDELHFINILFFVFHNLHFLFNFLRSSGSSEASIDGSKSDTNLIPLGMGITVADSLGHFMDPITPNDCLLTPFLRGVDLESLFPVVSL